MSGLCIRCNIHPITTVNMPCQCSCYCNGCAIYTLEHRSKCKQCNTRIRHYHSISQYQEECKACGFICDRQSTHVCSATKYTMIIIGDLSDRPHLEETFITAARGWDFVKVTNPAVPTYKIALCDSYFEEMMQDLKQSLLYLEHSNNVYSVQTTEPELFCYRCEDELDYNFYNTTTINAICQGCREEVEAEEEAEAEKVESLTCDRCDIVVDDRFKELVDTGDEPGNNKFCKKCDRKLHPDKYN